MEAIVWINYLLSTLFLACYGYQFLYMLYALLFPKKTAPVQIAALSPTPSGKRYALLVCARNEEAVIGDLLESIRAQSYPQALLEAFVAADNCTDLTALIARQQGATVYERFDTAKVGKGYALQFLLSHIWKDRGQDAFDGYFILDADNLLSTDFVARMDETFSQGYRIVTGYRASKNYGENWISAGYALWFLRESRFLNGARMGLGTSCTVNGTGFLIHKDVLLQNGGWKHFLLTEDAEFSADCVLQGERIAYCPQGVFFDEQPVCFSQSWRQRLRWCKGYFQVLRRYGGRLFRRSLALRGFAAFDLAMSILPALAITLAGCALNVVAAMLILLSGGSNMSLLLRSALDGMLNMYLTLFFMGSVITLAEWNRLDASPARKLLYALSFPIFTLTYLPISVAALFQRVEWKPVYHGEQARPAKESLRLQFARIRSKIELPR